MITVLRLVSSRYPFLVPLSQQILGPISGQQDFRKYNYLQSWSLLSFHLYIHTYVFLNLNQCLRFIFSPVSIWGLPVTKHFLLLKWPVRVFLIYYPSLNFNILSCMYSWQDWVVFPMFRGCRLFLFSLCLCTNLPESFPSQSQVRSETGHHSRYLKLKWNHKRSRKIMKEYSFFTQNGPGFHKYKNKRRNCEIKDGPNNKK